jgi:hypothetical protein
MLCTVGLAGENKARQVDIYKIISSEIYHFEKQWEIKEPWAIEVREIITFWSQCEEMPRVSEGSLNKQSRNESERRAASGHYASVLA